MVITWLRLRSNNLIVSSLTQATRYLQSENRVFECNFGKNWKKLPLDKSSDVIFPGNTISFEEQSVRVSQKRIFLSKWPEIMVEPDPSVMTRSLQLEPANFVSTPGKIRIRSSLFYAKWLLTGLTTQIPDL